MYGSLSAPAHIAGRPPARCCRSSQANFPLIWTKFRFSVPPSVRILRSVILPSPSPVRPVERVSLHTLGDKTAVRTRNDPNPKSAGTRHRPHRVCWRRCPWPCVRRQPAPAMAMTCCFECVQIYRPGPLVVLGRGVVDQWIYDAHGPLLLGCRQAKHVVCYSGTMLSLDRSCEPQR